MITFDYPEAPLPRYKFGDRVAVSDECAPINWLTGKIIGLTLDETYQSIWYFRVRLDTSSGLTEEYQADELVAEQQIPALQTEWEANDTDWLKESRPSKQKPVPKFDPGMRVQFTKQTGCNASWRHGRSSELQICQY